jgi:hypothetical protein
VIGCICLSGEKYHISVEISTDVEKKKSPGIPTRISFNRSLFPDIKPIGGFDCLTIYENDNHSEKGDITP